MPDTKRPTYLTFTYSCMIFDVMLEQATEEPAANVKNYGYPAQSGETVRVFRGTALKICNDLGLTSSTGQRCMTLLSAMRSTTLLKSGGPGYPSIYLLHYKPTDEQYQKYRQHTSDKNTKINPTKYELLLRDLESLRATSMSQLKMIEELGSRVAALERTGSHGR